MHYVITRLRSKIILVDFNFAVSTQTAKPPNSIPCQFSDYTVDVSVKCGGKMKMGVTITCSG